MYVSVNLFMCAESSAGKKVSSTEDDSFWNAWLGDEQQKQNSDQTKEASVSLNSNVSSETVSSNKSKPSSSKSNLIYQPANLMVAGKKTFDDGKQTVKLADSELNLSEVSQLSNSLDQHSESHQSLFPDTSTSEYLPADLSSSIMQHSSLMEEDVNYDLETDPACDVVDNDIVNKSLQQNYSESNIQYINDNIKSVSGGVSDWSDVSLSVLVDSQMMTSTLHSVDSSSAEKYVENNDLYFDPNSHTIASSNQNISTETSEIVSSYVSTDSPIYAVDQPLKSPNNITMVTNTFTSLSLNSVPAVSSSSDLSIVDENTPLENIGESVTSSGVGDSSVTVSESEGELTTSDQTLTETESVSQGLADVSDVKTDCTLEQQATTQNMVEGGDKTKEIAVGKYCIDENEGNHERQIISNGPRNATQNKDIDEKYHGDITLETSGELKNMLEDAMVESRRATDSPTDSSEALRVESTQSSGHDSSTEEMETTTSSDIEVISHYSDPNGNSDFRFDRPFNISPLRQAYVRSTQQTSSIFISHRKTDSDSSSYSLQSKTDVDDLRSPDTLPIQFIEDIDATKSRKSQDSSFLPNETCKSELTASKRGITN